MNSDFSYTDGDTAEKAVAAAVAAAPDRRVGSVSLMSQISDWATLYHLSSARANLLRPIADRLIGRSVLELGAGCGALTRFLAEVSASVVAVEGSARRASICATRCEGLDNVAVVHDTFEDLDVPGPFDVVTLIGVLEYSRQYGDGEDAPLTLLRRCRRWLADDGLLVLAIENQLGLKYLAGAPEDHVPQPFLGVNDLYGPRTVVTFGRVELQRLLRRAGFERIEMFAPFPDYKLPRIVVHERAFDAASLDLASVIRSVPATAQAYPYQRTFSEEMSWPVFIRNGLGLDVANSFLVIASSAASNLELDERSVWLFSTERQRCFAKCKTISVGSDGLRVRTERLYEEQQPSGAFRQSLVADESYLNGTLFATGFYRVVNRPGWTLEDVSTWVRPWIAWLKTMSVGTDHAGITTLPTSFLEAIPRNIIVTEGGEFVPFDLEWHAVDPLPLPYIVWRGLLSLFRQTASVASPGRSLKRYVRRHGIHAGDLTEIAAELLVILGLSNSKPPLAEYEAREFAFQRYVFGDDLVKARLPAAGQVISVRTGSTDDAGLRDLIVISVQRAVERIAELKGQ